MPPCCPTSEAAQRHSLGRGAEGRMLRGLLGSVGGAWARGSAAMLFGRCGLGPLGRGQRIECTQHALRFEADDVSQILAVRPRH
jgi:hypothetical protein